MTAAYLQHLLLTNDIQPVKARTDILSANGDIILKAEAQLSQDAVTLIGRTNFDQSLEELFILEQEFTADTIYQLLNEFVLSDANFAQLYELRDLNEKFIQCVEAFSKFDLLRQRLNVLAIGLPDIFDQSLFCGWMAVTVLAHENYPQNDLNDAFIAALSHDFGLLDISPDILYKQGPLEAFEWEALQQHPLFSASLLKRTRGIEKSTIRAVLEHHESIDGTGYPRGRYEKQLCDVGRLLNTLDSVNAIYRKHFRHRGRTLHDLVPTIQMTTLSRGGHFIETLTALFNQTKKTEHCSLSEDLVEPVINLVKANAHGVEEFVNYAAAFSKSAGVDHKDLKILSLQNIARLIKTTLTSCGIINDAYLRWLEQVEKEKLEFAYRELEDVLFMTEEIKFHINRYQRQISVYLSSPTGSPALRDLLSTHLSQLKQIPQPEITQAMTTFLAGKT